MKTRNSIHTRLIIADTAERLINICDAHNCSYEEGWYRYLCPNAPLYVSLDNVIAYLCGDLKQAN
ncbi:MAG: hypothetical protein ABF608_07385 [Sporolactobacillus sp.]